MDEWINNSSNWTHLFSRVNSTCSSCESYVGVSKASIFFKNLQKSQGLPLPPTFAQLSGLRGESGMVPHRHRRAVALPHRDLSIHKYVPGTVPDSAVTRVKPRWLPVGDSVWGSLLEIHLLLTQVDLTCCFRGKFFV